MAEHHVSDKNFYVNMIIPTRRGCAPGGYAAASDPIPRHRSLDTDCKAHDLDNLYVVDTSFFPSIGAVNPALTAMANAIRVGEVIYLARR